MERLELEPSVRQGFLSAQWLSLPYQGWGLSPSCWSRSPEGRAWAGSVPLKCVFPPLSELAPLPQSGGVLKRVGLVKALCSCCLQTEVQAVSNALPVQACTTVFLVLLRHRLRCKSPLFLTADQCPQPPAPPPCCWAISLGRWGLCGHLACDQGVSCGGAAAVRGRGYFRCTAWVSSRVAATIPHRPCPGTSSSLPPTVESSPQSWLPQNQCCSVTWNEQDQSLCLAWVHAKAVMGNPAGTAADPSPPCLRARQHMSVPHNWSPGFPQPSC